MGQIHLLDRHTAELIAAGEVVERPASVVKELLENAVDAGADAVTVEIKNGGVTLMRVVDNGCGMEREDVPTAFLRHATSKINAAEDLESIASFGFRGEALASIAAVAKVELVTRRGGELAGTLCHVQGGSRPELTDVGCAPGTTITVRDLFYNTPARMKFLKKDSAEGAAVTSVVERLAVAQPEVAVKFIRDGAVKFQTPGNGELLSAIYAVYGPQFAASLLEVTPDTTSAIQVHGYVSLPHEVRGSRSMQNFYVNGRWIRSPLCSSAVEQAYRNQIMTGKFPACVLKLELDPSMVDVNVHPAKTEVKFADEKQLFGAVYYAVKAALAGADLTPEAKLNRPGGGRSHLPAFPEGASGVQSVLASSHTPAGGRSADSLKPREELWEPLYRPLVETEVSVPSVRAQVEDERGMTVHGSDSYYGTGFRLPMRETVPPAASSEIREDDLEETQVGKSAACVSAVQTAQERENPLAGACLVGELFGTYLIVQAGDNAYFVDKHAAHERLLFEKLRSAKGELDRQVLLVPLTMQLSAQEYELCLQNLQLLQDLGMVAQDFGDNTVLLREIPVMLDIDDAQETFYELLQTLQTGSPEPTPQKLDDLYHSIACRAAVKAHDKNAPLELDVLLKMLGEQGVNYCPHGRPVKIVISRRELEKQFRRVL